MAKTKESIQAYNKEYCARPYAIQRAKERNALLRDKRKAYKKTEKGREAENRYRRKKESTDESKNRHLLQRYGISLDEYRNLLEGQGGLCLICNIKSNYKLHVDHCHTTGKVRGLLCGSCNRALGLLKDNTMFLLKAIEYLNGK